MTACSFCGEERSLTDLLLVTELAGMHRSRYVCRNVSRACWRSIRDRSVETITPAVQPPVREYVPTPPRVPGRVRRRIEDEPWENGKLVSSDRGIYAESDESRPAKKPWYVWQGDPSTKENR